MRPVFVLLITLRLAAAADSSLSSYFPVDTKAVMGIHLKALGAAGLFQGMDGEIRKTATGVLADSPLAGFDPLKDLDEVVIATTAGGDKPPSILVLRGRFPIDKLDPAVTRYRDVPVIESPKQPGGMLALIDAGTAIAGDIELVRAAIDRRGEERPAAPWEARMEALRTKCAIWGFGDGIESKGSQSKPGDLSSIDRFEFGVAFDKGLRLGAEIHVRTPEDAEKMSASLKLVEAMMKGQKKPAKGTGFDLQSDNKGTLRISLVLPEAELKKAMQEERSTLAAAISSGLPALMSSRQMGFAPQAEPPAPPPIPVYRQPVPSDTKVVSNAEGDTVVVTLPGALPIKD